VHGMHAATSRVVNSAQGSSCKLKFVNGSANKDFKKENDVLIQRQTIKVIDSSNLKSIALVTLILSIMIISFFNKWSNF
jgi:hypothetical protein